ncbi:MAG: TIGR03905 family TSCPD domain-containing protein [Treponema sp.]|jgi:uncharacterized protein (TIGR03905 family)|nr:TIGR03905 family TSCPD domain-containing protein [Treponema sp.]
MYEYTTQGTCSSKIRFDIRDNRVCDVAFEGGCNGNLKGISILVEGMDANELVKKLKGVRCGFKQTSCPDQLATAIELVAEAKAKEQ